MELIEIENYLLSGNKNIELKKIKQFMQSHNIEVKGVIVELLTNPNLYKFVYPKMSFSDYYEFLFDYYVECMKNNYDGDWSHSPYLAAYELKNFISKLWDDNQLTEKQIINLQKDIRLRLEKLALDANSSFRVVLINGLFEHLFENKKILKYFNIWEKKDVLNQYISLSLDKIKPLED